MKSLREHLESERPQSEEPESGKPGKPRLYWKYFRFGEGKCLLSGRLGELEIDIKDVHPAMLRAFALNAIAMQVNNASRNVYRATQDEKQARKASLAEWERIKAGKVEFYDAAKDELERFVCEPLARALKALGKNYVTFNGIKREISEESLLEVYYDSYFDQKLRMMGKDYIRYLRDREDVQEQFELMGIGQIQGSTGIDPVKPSEQT